MLSYYREGWGGGEGVDRYPVLFLADCPSRNPRRTTIASRKLSIPRRIFPLTLVSDPTGIGRRRRLQTQNTPVLITNSLKVKTHLSWSQISRIDLNTNHTILITNITNRLEHKTHRSVLITNSLKVKTHHLNRTYGYHGGAYGPLH